MSISGNVDEVAHSHESALVKYGTLNAVFAEYPCKFFGSGGDSALVLAPDGVPQNYVILSFKSFSGYDHINDFVHIGFEQLFSAAYRLRI